MVRLTTTYDAEVGKVFKLRGDERYAWTTDIIISTSKTSESIEGYTLSVTAKVLRDRGASNLLLYDGDTLLKVVSVDDDDDSVTIGSFLMKWGVEHDLWIRYQGNKQCLASTSKTENWNIPLPATYKTQITWSSNVRQLELSGTRVFSPTIALTINGEVVSNVYDAEVYWYLDGNLVDTTSTGQSSNTTTADIPIPTDGLHTIRVAVSESSDRHSAEDSDNWSVGYNFYLSDVPHVYNNGSTNTIKATILDWFGNGVSKNIHLWLNNKDAKTVTSNTNGLASFSVTDSVKNPVTVYASYGNYQTTSKTINVSNINGFTLTPASKITSSGYDNIITATMDGEYIDGLKVTFIDNDNHTSKLVPVIDGVATYTTHGRDYDYSITAVVMGKTKTITLDGVEQYIKRVSYDESYTYNKNMNWYLTSPKIMPNTIQLTGKESRPTQSTRLWNYELGFYKRTNYPKYRASFVVNTGFRMSALKVSLKKDGTVVATGGDYEPPTSYNIVVGDTIKCEVDQDKGLIDLYINNKRVTRKQGSLSSVNYDEIDITVVGNGIVKTLKVNELKVERIQ